MSVTRRSILRTLAALSAVQTVPGLRSGLAFAASSPNPDSVFVAFEGPWIIDAQAGEGKVRATTLGALSNDIHFCEAGLVDTETHRLRHPSDASLPPLVLKSGAAWTVQAGTGKTATRNALAVFDDAFAREPFVYIRDKGMKLNPRAEDRLVTLPVPDRVYASQPLSHSTVVDPEHLVEYTAASPNPPQPHQIVVFEYRNAPLSLLPGTDSLPLTAGQRLVFRVEHSPDTVAESVHIQNAFTSLAARVGAGSRTLPLSLKVSDDANPYHAATYQPGQARLELVVVDLWDCCGGGIVIIGH